MENQPDTRTPQVAGLTRRCAAMFYDTLLLLSILFAGTALALLVTAGELDYRHPLFRGFLLLLGFLFYAWPWLQGGQTLGMSTWKIRLESLDGGPVSFRQAIIRFLCAIPAWLLFGLGYLWMLVDRDGLAVHDRLSGTRIVRTPRGVRPGSDTPERQQAQ